MSARDTNRRLSSVTSFASDLTVALASFGNDFTLYKAPAPPEYSGLGNALSRRRRAAAEDGHVHIVARKLGKLFHNFLPPVTTLIKAYGERASQIASKARSDAGGISAFSSFADFAGVDGTSLWAAATSSHESLCLHLLACMLARIWSAPQATSIWVEIVEQRQLELGSLDANDPLHLSEIASSRLELSRDDLANWDASARAWLCIADETMKREQTRLLLLIDKTKLPVDVSQGVYQSVVHTWKTALTTVDKIIDGMSYDVQNGAVLLGLASWHLFPTMHVFVRNCYRHIEQNDSVLPRAGVLTFGIEAQSHGDRDGLQWSLPLAHLRFYGYPVVAKRTMGTNAMRVTLSEFLLVALGSLFARWGDYAHDLITCAKLVSSMWDYICSCTNAVDKDESQPSAASISAKWQEYYQFYVPTSLAGYNVDNPHLVLFPQLNSWFKLLADAADDLVSSDGLDRQAKERLIERGVRKYPEFLAPMPERPIPMFGLSTLVELMPILHEEGVVQCLRAYIRETNLNPGDVIIRYRHRQLRHSEGRHKVHFLRSLNTQSKPNAAKSGSNLQETSLPEWRSTRTMKRPRQEFTQDDLQVPLAERTDLERDENESTVNVKIFEDAAQIEQEPMIGFESLSTKRLKTGLEHVETESAKEEFQPQRISDSTEEYFEYASALPFQGQDSNPTTQGHVRYIPEARMQQQRINDLQTLGEDVKSFLVSEIFEYDDECFTWQHEDSNEAFTDAFGQQVVPLESNYVLLFGHSQIGAVFRKTDCAIEMGDSLEAVDVQQAFESGSVDPNKFLTHLCNFEKSQNHTPKLIRSLRGIASAATVYKLMPTATITTSIFSEPLYEARWLSLSQAGFFSRKHQSSIDDLFFSRMDSKADHNIRAANTDQYARLHGPPLNRPETFACIAMFENAALNMDSDGLDAVMALSAANSLYIAMPLLCDPIEEPKEWEIKHVRGNIGQPGISFLIPPPDPKVHKSLDNSWELVNHAAFDGKFEDNFGSTSLHASFTKFAIPVGLDLQGGQDVEAYFRQTLVRLHGHDGRWIADLDILGSLRSSLLQRYKTNSCTHTKTRKDSPSCVLKSIDNWHEFLDRPKAPGVVRATGNWQARLAATALNVQLGHPVLVLPNSNLPTDNQSKESSGLCWACATAHFELGNKQRQRGDRAKYFNPTELPFFIA